MLIAMTCQIIMPDREISSISGCEFTLYQIGGGGTRGMMKTPGLGHALVSSYWTQILARSMI